MSSSAPAKNTQAAIPLSRVPPDEQFWQRYSPHGEAPMSVAGSVALHALVVGLMVLFVFYLASVFSKPNRSLPIEPVRLAGGGGGSKNGANIDGKGAPTHSEDVGGDPSSESNPGAEDAPIRPSLNPVEEKALTEKFVAADVRLIQRSETGKALARLQDSVRRKLALGDGNSAKGNGGPGTGGGKGTGAGTGEGPGVGPGKATLSKREKRMIRWRMIFTNNTGPEYLAQLRSLGAILAFPVREGDDTQFKIVRDLQPGGAAIDEDVSNIQRIFWIDDNPRAVRDIMGALGLRLPSVPSRFVAFMPEKLESELAEMERGYVERVLRRKFDKVEDKIIETQFRVVRRAGGFRPELISVQVAR